MPGKSSQILPESSPIVVLRVLRALRGEGLSVIASGNKKALPDPIGLLGSKRETLRRQDADGLFLERALDGEVHRTGDLGKQRMVLADADILAGMNLGAALAHDNAACGNHLSAITLHAEPFGL